MIIDLHAPGVQVSPIPLLTGEAHFCEVSLTDVTVPAGQVLGELGHGWAQVTSELVYERAGTERWLSTYILVEQYLRERDCLDETGLRFLGSTAGGCGRCVSSRYRSPAVWTAGSRPPPGPRWLRKWRPALSRTCSSTSGPRSRSSPGHPPSCPICDLLDRGLA
jgi:hypothetical protein